MYAALVASVSVLVLGACGTDDGGVAEDPAPAEATSSSPTEEPTTEPTVGSYPEFEPQDYSFHLVVSCFCLGAGVPIKVAVEDGAVVGATYLSDDHGRSGVKKGDPADKVFWLTINDIIGAANNTGAAQVDVDWPAGQAYPSNVYVDKDKNMVDEEVGYTISKVRVA
jgi:hypothetical protein